MEQSKQPSMQFRCGKCGAQFESQDALRDHQKMHQDEQQGKRPEQGQKAQQGQMSR
jgi:C2H2-type zinc finger protein